MVIRGEGFDCRLLLDGKTLERERWYEVPVKFLSREQADTVLAVGQAITLWDEKPSPKGSSRASIPCHPTHDGNLRRRRKD